MKGSVMSAVVPDFVDLVRHASSISDLRALMTAMTAEIGYSHFALIHHTDLRDGRGIINVNDYPPGWSERVVRDRLYRHDPVVHACFRTNAAFRWSDLPAIVPLDAPGLAVLQAAAKEGLDDGVTVPACVPGEPMGSCSFARPKKHLNTERTLGVAQFAGAFGFAAARRLVAGGALRLPRRARFTPRQRDCIVLVARGKTDWEIGVILGLSRVTVKHYLDDARGLFDVTTRTQLVFHALLEGEISFLEIAPEQYVHLDG